MTPELLADHKCEVCHATVKSTSTSRAWFGIVLASEGTTLHFCPKHALAAEVASDCGMPGRVVVQIIKKALCRS